MATEVEKLIVELDAKTRKYNNDMKKSGKVTDQVTGKIGKDLNKMSRSQDSARQSIGKMKVAVLAGAVALTAIGVKIINVTRQFQKFDAQLKTATGSAEGAADAMLLIQEFAETTPFSIEQSITAFTKLRNLGLDPGEDALRSYGNTAVAMGKDLNQMIEAVADAATGEFERLKEFGIKAKTEGDKVAFAFQGQTTTVGKNAKEITEFLQSIGNVQFAGAMQEQFDTLDGVISNFGDNFDQVLNSIGKSGFGDLVGEGLTTASAALKDFSVAINSGEVAARLEAVFGQFSGFGEDLEGLFNVIGGLWNDLMNEFPNQTQQSSDQIGKIFANFPEFVRAFVKVATVEIAAFIDRTVARFEFLGEAVAAIFTDDTIDAASKRLDARLKISDAARLDSIDIIFQEAEADIKATEIKIENSKKLTEQFLKEREARREKLKDEGGLSQFGIKVEGDPDAQTNDEKKAEKTLKDSIQKKIDEIDARQQLQREADLNVVEALESRLALEDELIRNAVENEVISKEDAIERKLALDLEYAENLADLAETGLEMLVESIDLELELHQELLDKKLISEEEFQNRVNATNNKGAADRIALAQKEARAKAGLDNVTLKTGIAAIETLGSLGKKEAKAAFFVKKIQKGSEAVVNTASGITEALPNVPLAVATGILGAAQIAVIASQSFEGGASGGGGGVSASAAGSVESAPELDTASVTVDETVVGAEGASSFVTQLEFTADSGDQIGEMMAEIMNESVKNGKTAGVV